MTVKVSSKSLLGDFTNSLVKKLHAWSARLLLASKRIHACSSLRKTEIPATVFSAKIYLS